MAADPAAVGVVVLLKQVAAARIVGGKVAQKGLPKLSVGLPGPLGVRPLDAAVVVQGAEGEVVDVDPDLAAPVGRVVRRVVPLVKAAAGR